MEDEKIKKIGVGREEVCEWGVVIFQLLPSHTAQASAYRIHMESPHPS